MIHFAGHKAVGESVAKPLDYYENNLGSTLLAGARDAALRRRQAGLLLQRDGLRRPTRPAPTEDRPHLRHQPLRLDQGDAGADPARRRRRRPRHAVRAAALLQPGRRARVRHDRRGPVGHPQQPDALHRPGRGRQAARSCRSSATTTTRPTAPACATTSTSRTSPPATSPRSRRSPPPTRPVNVWNLGSGHGTSVLELLHAFEKAVGRELPYEVVGRRPGDVATSYADPSQGQRRARLEHRRSRSTTCAPTPGAGSRRTPRATPADAPPGAGVSWCSCCWYPRTWRSPRHLVHGGRPRSRPQPLAGRTIVIDPGHQLGNHNFPRRRSTGRCPPAGSPSPATPPARRPTAATRRRPSPGRCRGCSRARLRELGATVRHDPAQQPAGPLGSVRRRARPGRQPDRRRPQGVGPR